jgi:hypothetical protein
MADGRAPSAGELQRTFSLKVPFRDFRKFPSQKFFWPPRISKTGIADFQAKSSLLQASSKRRTIPPPNTFSFLKIDLVLTWRIVPFLLSAAGVCCLLQAAAGNLELGPRASRQPKTFWRWPVSVLRNSAAVNLLQRTG